MDAGLAAMVAVRFLSGVASAYGMIFITALVIDAPCGRPPSGTHRLPFRRRWNRYRRFCVSCGAAGGSGCGLAGAWAGAAIEGLRIADRGNPADAAARPAGRRRDSGAKEDSFGLPLVILDRRLWPFRFRLCHHCDLHQRHGEVRAAAFSRSNPGCGWSSAFPACRRCCFGTGCRAGRSQRRLRARLPCRGFRA